ncbi:MAG: hypothetical protein IT325_00765 [Anaerolineae bacterium]|nr:hypothetical protein [Anaerolineae bacterium]
MRREQVPGVAPRPTTPYNPGSYRVLVRHAGSSGFVTLPETSPPDRPRWRAVAALWLGWYLALIVFQQIVWARFTLDRPDYAYPWTGDMTGGYADGPATGPWFYARWDSPRYVAIAREGYRPDGGPGDDRAAFYPVYPLLMRAVHTLMIAPLGLGDWSAGGHADAGYALAGIIVSAGMSLAAALAMYALAWDRLGPDAAWRAAFYLLIFPSALYLAQVYTEATYLAFALAMLAALYRRRWLIALPLIVLATLTRPVGLFLVLPFAAAWLRDWWNGVRPPRWALIGVIAPPLAWLGWNRWLASLGVDPAEVYASFNREILSVRGLLDLAGDVIYIFREPNGVHVALDLVMALGGIALCLLALRRQPGLALYGLAAIGLPLSSGQLTSMSRYVLAAAPIFLVLARAGERPVFDRVWTVISLLWFALYVVLYVHGFWLA